jgi:hypothetical protein
LAGSVRDELVEELKTVTGVKAVLPRVPLETPEQLPALILWRVQASQSYPAIGFEIVERTRVWKLIVWVELREYEQAQDELEQLWDRLLDLQHQDSSLDAVCREWSIEDDGEEPDFNEKRGVYEKRLTVRTLTEERP